MESPGLTNGSGEAIALAPPLPEEPHVTPTAGRKERKIAIFGTTPSRMQGPIDDESWEIWTIGPGGKDVHRWDRLFEVHQVWPLDFGEIPDEAETSYLNDLSRVKFPQQVITLKPMPAAMEEWAREHGKSPDWLKEHVRGDWSANVAMSRDSLFDKYGRMWFSSSISYCIAMAIEEGATDIGCWGIDLESGEEYISQHMGAKHFLDLARLAGINLHFPKGCGLLRDLTPYPDRYETHLALTLEKKFHWLNHQLGQIEPERQNAELETYRTEGALLIMRKLLAVAAEKNAAGEDLAQLIQHIEENIPHGEKDLIALNGKLGQLNANKQHMQGELSATQFYRRMYTHGLEEPG